MAHEQTIFLIIRTTKTSHFRMTINIHYTMLEVENRNARAEDQAQHHVAHSFTPFKDK